MKALLLVGAGGFAGSAARYQTGQWLSRWTGPGGFPWATLAVNLLGCVIIGLLAAASLRWTAPGSSGRLLLFTGLLGGFTTFSAFGLETVELWQRSQHVLALGYVLASVAGGLLAVALGMKLAAA